MSIFAPIQDFFHRRQAECLNELTEPISLVNRHQESHQVNFVYPGIDYADYIKVEGQPVGFIEYGISPLMDRVYISDFKIFSNHRRHGFGMAALWLLWTQYQMPLTPMHMVGSSIGFWITVRKRFAAAGVELTQGIRTSDQKDEQQRWQYLVPKPQRERLMRELQALPEWPAIKARIDVESGLCPKH